MCNNRLQAPTFAGKCIISNWFPCGVDGWAGGPVDVPSAKGKDSVPKTVSLSLPRDPKMDNSHPTDRALYCPLYPKSKMASAEMLIARMRKTHSTQKTLRHFRDLRISL